MQDAGTASGNNKSADVGGVIGCVRSAGNALTFTNVTLGTTTGDKTQSNVARYGGLVGSMTATNSGNRSVSINGVTVAGLDVRIQNDKTNGRGNGVGGLLGYAWLNANVTVASSDKLQIGPTGSNAPSFSVTAGTCANYGGLVYRATGYWDIAGLELTAASFSATPSGGSFGMLVNDGTYDGSPASALYLELKHTDGTDYKIAGAAITGTYAAFDEIVAYSAFPDKNIVDNGQAVVSVATTDGKALVMTGEGCNTYQNQTAFGRTAALHSHSRYYYNLDQLRAAASPSNGQKLLLWSLNQYAHDTVKNLKPDGSTKVFNGGFTGTTISGDCDMAGLSYYPVSADSVTIAAETSIKFYNAEIEAGEARTEAADYGDSYTDALVRSTRTATQHLLMHSGILYDAKDLTVNGLTLKGTVGMTAGVTGVKDGSGFLVRGTLHDKNATGSSSLVRDIVLAVAAVQKGTGVNNAIGDDYAPLLINKLGDVTVGEYIAKPTNLTVSGVTVDQSDATDKYDDNAKAASSLIGDAVGEKMTLTFSGVSLDARKTESAVDAGLDTAYGTKQSLFTRATLMNKFEYSDTLSSGSYNYSHAEDWGVGAKRVTYGLEISGSTEYSRFIQNEYIESVSRPREKDAESQ